MITVDNIQEKERTFRGKKYQAAALVGYHADIIPGKSIRLYGSDTQRHHKDYSFNITFFIGSWAEYDSYNLIYIGKIIAIGKNTITIQHQHGNRISRLNLYQFAWRNYDFNLAKIASHNQEEMMCI